MSAPIGTETTHVTLRIECDSTSSLKSWDNTRQPDLHYHFSSAASSEGISITTTSCEDTTVVAGDSTSVTLGGSLAVGATTTCSGSYAISQEDVNALEVSASASVVAHDSHNNTVEAVGSTVVSLDQVRRKTRQLKYEKPEVLYICI